MRRSLINQSCIIPANFKNRRDGMPRYTVIMLTVLCFLPMVLFADPVPTTIDDFFMPGSQPLQSGTMERPDRCDNCHGDYNLDVEPAYNWRGSMMSQAMRDPLFLAFLTIANQDAPESGDLCIRCHSPGGWLEGRSEPTDGSALNEDDRESVQCDFCHKVVKPTQLGVNPYPDDPDYTADTYPRDQEYLATLDIIPEWSGNGMFIVDSDNAKRGPYVDAEARHQMFYSPFHTDIDVCGTCHDVSNPAFTKDENGKYVPNTFGEPAPDFDPYSMFPIERTYSEWKMSDYNTPEGVYAPQFGGNLDYVRTCQDCHMRDVTGAGCNKNGSPIRDDLALHDMTGGNTFMPLLIESVYPGEADTVALNSGIQRAIYLLENAATMELTAVEQGENYLANVNLINETGHKLPSGYPEGRRIWINMKAYDLNDALIYESGAYNLETAELTHDEDVKIYEIKPGISESLSPVVNIPAGPSFHFVLNDTVYKDNRIPARGFTNADYEMIGSPPVDYNYPDGQYWDDTEYMLPEATAKIVVSLYYQTTTKEFVEFLRDENVTDDRGITMYNLWESFGKCPPVVMAKDSLLLEPQEYPDVSIEMIPDNPPIVIPAGGYFTFTGILTNNTAEQQTTDVWIMLDVPNYGMYGPIQQFNNISLAPNQVLTAPNVRQDIPGFAPLGLYDYIGYCGNYDIEIEDSAVFQFEVISSMKKGADEWNLSNWITSETSQLASATDIFVGYPNPFNNSTMISYSLAVDEKVEIAVYNIAGQRVAMLYNGRQSAGNYSLQWDAKDCNSGVYFIKLNIGAH
ncbi:MAG: T9SS type A sorting domain-containing protein, partial [candidate division Zixibacteria bacterium]|nr:T9SS type A sorting domain-containing protein [candidate division Zixibacteria bacterium]